MQLTPAYKIKPIIDKSIQYLMSTPKLIRIYSPSSKSQNNKQTCCTQAPAERSSLDTVIMNQKTSQMQSYHSLLIDQVKKLSRDNDRMWKLLTQTDQQHNECNKTQRKLKQNLQCAQKQLSMMKQMYSVEKSNFQQSKFFFQKRQQQWQEIVGELKKVIQNYQSTNSIDMQRASEIFTQTTELKSPKPVERLPNFDKELSIYSKRNGNYQNQSQKNSKFQSKCKQSSQSYLKQSEIKYRQEKQMEKSQSGSIMSSASKKHRSKLFNSKNFLNKSKNVSQSTKRICEKVHHQQMTNLEYFPSNPQDVYELLTTQDIFQRALRKTYVKYRNSDQRAYEILDLPHMQKLKTAKSSTKQRLHKTIRKVFVFDSPQQFDDVVKYIEDKVYKKYHLLKGELIFKFLQDKFKECEQIFQASNSALDRLDREPSDFINGVTINSKFRNFEDKRRQIRSSDAKSLKFTQMVPNQNLKGYDNESIASKNSSHMGLSINSNIKDKPLISHLNNHIKNQNSQRQKQQRQNSRKNIYTDSRLSRRNLVEQLSRSNKSESIQGSSINKNLSSLIGASQQYEMTSRRINDSSKGGIYNRTADYS